MKVYRYLSRSELEAIKNNEIDKLGQEYSRFDKGEINNHRYKPNEKYLHFFADKQDLCNIQLLYRKSNKVFYLCEFNIPFTTLMFHRGTGYYQASGYDIDYITAKEFALPTSKFKAEFLTSFSLDENKSNNDEMQL